MKKSVRFGAIFTVFLALISSAAWAEFARTTSFDDRESCEKTRGVWREYGNSLGDSCEGKFDQFAIAPQVVTYSCDCGKNKCWNGDRCVMMREYKKVYEQQQQKDQAKIAAARKARSEEYRETSNDRVGSMIAQTKGGQGDPKQSANNNMAQFYDKVPLEDVPANDKNIGANDGNNNKKQGGLIQQPPVLKVLTLPENNQNAVQNNQSAETPTDPITIIPAIPAPMVDSVNNSGPTPFFLQQQEKAKQEAAASGMTNSKSNKAQDSALPGLPQIPLPQ